MLIWIFGFIQDISQLEMGKTYGYFWNSLEHEQYHVTNKNSKPDKIFMAINANMNTPPNSFVLSTSHILLLAHLSGLLLNLQLGQMGKDSLMR